jgi:hypothetical protein
MSVAWGMVTGMGTAADSVLSVLAGVAEHESDRFTARNLRVRRSPVVHAVRMTPWLAGLELPAPACGQGWSGAGVGELHPVALPVTCHHCLASAAALAVPVAAPPGQLPLPLAIPEQRTH